jgi:TolB-like protein
MLALALSLAASVVGAAERPVVAVLYFDNDTNKREYDVLQKGVADMMVTDLAASDQVTVVEREKLQGVIDELKLQRSKYFDAKTAQKLGQMVGAKYAVTGSFVAIEPLLRIDIRLVEVATGRLVVTEKVTGKQDEFLDLQQALVQKFLAALQLKTSAPAGGKADVATVLKYAQSVDLSDKGDLEGAKKQLASIVSDAPEFVAAQSRYAAVLKKLRESSARRTTALQSSESELEAKAREVVNAGVESVDAGRSWQPLARYFGYRAVLGRIALARMARIAGAANAGYVAAWVPPSKRAEYVALQRIFIEETERLIAEMEARKSDLTNVHPYVPEGERAAVNELAKNGVVWGDFWPDFSLGKVKFDLGIFMLLGDTPFTPHPKMRPAPVAADPSLIKRAQLLLAQGRKELSARYADKPAELEELLSTLTESQAEALLAVGKKDEAVAQIQLFLDTYPRARKFKDFEKRVESLLGVSEDARAFQAGIAGCKLEVAYKAGLVMPDIARADGLEGLQRVHAQVTKACAEASDKVQRMSVIPTVEMMIAQQAALLGDCALFAQAKATVQQESAASATAMDMMGPYCVGGRDR